MNYLDHASIYAAIELQQFYESRQYDHLADWSQERTSTGDYVPVRFRKPNVRYNLCKAMVNRLGGFLMGLDTFPNVSLPANSMEETLKWLREHLLVRYIPVVFRKACVQGSACLTFGFRRGKLLARTYNRTQAWPIFDDADELLALVILYESLDARTKKTKWTRIVLDSLAEVTSVADKLGDPWTATETVEHKFGFVPAVWFRNGADEPQSVDGQSLLSDVKDLQREIDYSLARRSRSLNYTADPQLVLSDNDPDKLIANLLKSPGKSWALSKDGKANYLEIEGAGIKLQGETAQELRRYALEVARVVMPDADKVAGGELSGFALRMLYEAMIDLADELKGPWTTGILELASKVLLSCVVLQDRSESASIPGLEELPGLKLRVPKSEGLLSKSHPWIEEDREWPMPVFVGDLLPLAAAWGPYFDVSPSEESQKVTAAAAAKNAGLLSRPQGVRHLAPVFRPADVEGEVAELEREAGEDGLQGV